MIFHTAKIHKTFQKLFPLRFRIRENAIIFVGALFFRLAADFLLSCCCIGQSAGWVVVAAMWGTVGTNGTLGMKKNEKNFINKYQLLKNVVYLHRRYCCSGFGDSG